MGRPAYGSEAVALTIEPDELRLGRCLGVIGERVGRCGESGDGIKRAGIRVNVLLERNRFTLQTRSLPIERAEP